MGDGYTKFPNDVLDAMTVYKFTRRQYVILLHVARNTYGWGRPYGDRISLTQLSKLTGIGRHHLSGALSDLEKMGVLTVERRDGSVSTIGINSPKNWDKPVPDSGTCTRRGTRTRRGTGGVPKTGTGTCTQNGYTSKKYIKDTIQKKEYTPTLSEEIEARVRAMHPGMSDEELAREGLL